jgi:hypothetical protein
MPAADQQSDPVDIRPDRSVDHGYGAARGRQQHRNSTATAPQRRRKSTARTAVAARIVT